MVHYMDVNAMTVINQEIVMRCLRTVLSHPLLFLAITVAILTIVAIRCEPTRPADGPPVRPWTDRHPEAFMGPSPKEVIEHMNRKGATSPPDVLDDPE